MSGGRFNYNQFRIRDIRESIESILERQGKEIPKDELYGSKDYYDKYPEEKFYETFSPEVAVRFREAIEVLEKAEIYAHEIDWYLSGDTGEESFLDRLDEKLNIPAVMSSAIAFAEWVDWNKYERFEGRRDLWYDKKSSYDNPLLIRTTEDLWNDFVKHCS